MKNKMKISLGLFAALFFLANTHAEAQVCVGYDQVAALVSAASNTEKEKQNQQRQPSLRNPPVMRAAPVQTQYLGDGVHVPNQERELRQKAYNASRASLDQQPLPQKASPPQTSSSSSGVGWGTLTGMIPSSGGGKCRGICY